MSVSVSGLCVTVGECVCLSESEWMNVCMHVSVNECECMLECVRYVYGPASVCVCASVSEYVLVSL